MKTGNFHTAKHTPIQAGCRSGTGFTLNAEEHHRCSEVNFVLAEGANAQLTAAPDSPLPGEDGLLWMRNKWLICHPDSPLAQKAAFRSITGENITLHI